MFGAPLEFSNAADYKPGYFGDHNLCAVAAVWLGNLLVPLYIIMTCTLCCAAKGIHDHDKMVLVPMMPMGGDTSANPAAGGAGAGPP